MAYLLDGPQLTHAKGFNIVSDGIAMGAIQVPGEGPRLVGRIGRRPFERSARCSDKLPEECLRQRTLLGSRGHAARAKRARD